MDMYGSTSEKTPQLPVAFATVAGGRILRAKTGQHARLFLRPIPTIDLSGPAIWALGVFSAALASYCGARQARIAAQKYLDGERGLQVLFPHPLISPGTPRLPAASRSHIALLNPDAAAAAVRALSFGGRARGAL